MNRRERALLERSRSRLEQARTAVENHRGQASALLHPVRTSVLSLPESTRQQVEPKLTELGTALTAAFTDVDLALARGLLRVLDLLSGPSPVIGSDPTLVSIDRQIVSALHHPGLASVVGKLLDDRAHAVDVVQALRTPDKSPDTMRVLDELSAYSVLDHRPFDEYLRYRHGRGPLFAHPRDEVHHLRGGSRRIDAFVTYTQQVDPIRALRVPTSGVIEPASLEWLRDYARRLRDSVQPTVTTEVGEIAATIGSARLSARAKTQGSIVAKVTRRAQDNVLRPGVPDFTVGHVLDAVGARLVVGDTSQLEAAYDATIARFGIGPDGRVLSIEDMYSTPRAYKPALRVIMVNCTTEVDGLPYPFELQLATQRAQLSADLDHNVVYKPYVETTPDERQLVSRMLQSAAVLDLEETRRNHGGA